MVFNKKIKYVIIIFTFLTLVLGVSSLIALCPFVYFNEAKKFDSQMYIDNSDFLYDDVHDFLVWQKPLSEEFTINEISHMRDVRFLFNLFRTIFVLFISSLVAGLVYFVLEKRKLNQERLRKKENQKALKHLKTKESAFNKRVLFFVNSLKSGSIFSLAFLVLLVLLVLINFTASFDVFHRIFFPQGNWIFPYDSLLITLFPSNFFFSMAKKTIIINSAIITIFILVLWFLEREMKELVIKKKK